MSLPLRLAVYLLWRRRFDDLQAAASIWLATARPFIAKAVLRYLTLMSP